MPVVKETCDVDLPLLRKSHSQHFLHDIQRKSANSFGFSLNMPVEFNDGCFAALHCKPSTDFLAPDSTCLILTEPKILR